MDRPTDRIVPLEEMADFGVAEGDLDVRGWDVLSGDGVRVGEVDDLLVDTTRMTVRYLDVDIAADAAGSGTRHVLIPLDLVRLDEEADHVVVDSLECGRIQNLPSYQPGALDQQLEQAIRNQLPANGP